jgi:hypothetical protein
MKHASIAIGLALLVAPLSAQTGERAPLGDKPVTTVVSVLNHPTTMEVKFVHDSGVRLVDGHFSSSVDEVQAIDLLLDSIGATRERIFQQDDAWLTAWRASGEQHSGTALHDLTLFYRIVLPHQDMIAETCDALNAFAVVEIAYPLPTVSDPTLPMVAFKNPLGTPDFEANQGYRRAAPLGIDADFGQTFSGGQGIGTTIADVETGWTDDHEDVAHAAQDNFVGLCCAPYPWDHGTAVLGELIGEDQGEGVKGIVFNADVLLSTHQGSGANISTAIANGAAAVGVGDFLVIEVQCSGGPPAPYPCEYVASTFATVQTATANGTHVTAAAGNGNNNLDQAAYGGLFDRNVRDSGAIMVGASDGSSLNKASFSNYGTRLDAHGWGFNVATAGYGDLQSGPATQEYTATFSGTSSATPIVTGAAVQLNGINREVYGSNLDPLALRSLITNTGTPQGSGGQIGPRPNVRAALLALQVPRCSIAGNLVPGGNYTVTNYGQPNDACVLVFGVGINTATPFHSPPYGYFLLQGGINRVLAGVIDGLGQLDYNDSIPNIPGLSGTTIGYYQTWQRFQNGQSGVGAFGNYVPIEVQ